MSTDQSLLPLYDGHGTERWHMAGRGSFVELDGAIHAVPGDGLGLFWCDVPTPPDFELHLAWRRSAITDNSGVFLRFPDPTSKGYENAAWVGVHFGFEVQIDEMATPDGADAHRTGAIYNEPEQTFTRQLAKAVGEWNEYRIVVVGRRYTVFLNGLEVSDFVDRIGSADRGAPSTANDPRYIGVQSHTGLVSFRNTRIQRLACSGHSAEAPNA